MRPVVCHTRKTKLGSRCLTVVETWGTIRSVGWWSHISRTALWAAMLSSRPMRSLISNPERSVMSRLPVICEYLDGCLLVTWNTSQQRLLECVINESLYWHLGLPLNTCCHWSVCDINWDSVIGISALFTVIKLQILWLQPIDRDTDWRFPQSERKRKPQIQQQQNYVAAFWHVSEHSSEKHVSCSVSWQRPVGAEW